jgi:hypothetical protein
VNRENPGKKTASPSLQIDHPAGAFKPAPIIDICVRSKSCGQASVCAQIGGSGAHAQGLRRFPDQHVAACNILLGQVRDDQSHCHRITRPPPGPVNELNRAADDDQAFGPVAADNAEMIVGPHHPLFNEPGDHGAAAGEREDVVDLEPELVRRLVAHAPILSDRRWHHLSATSWTMITAFESAAVLSWLTTALIGQE